MAFKEFKKIVSNKWIIFFLVLLCLFNIFFSINSADKNIDSINYENKIQKEKIKEYSSYIQNMKKNLSAISNFRLFYTDDDYYKKSAEKTVKAYERVKDIQPVYGNYTVISSITKLGFSDIVIFILVLQCVIVLINSDRKNGMITLLRSCKNGRITLIFGKIKALFLAVVICVLMIYIPQGLGLIKYLGCSDLNVPIQSVAGFYECPLPMTVIQYIILFLIFKCLAVFAYSLMLLAGAVLFRNIGVLYTLFGIGIAISVLAKEQIFWDYKISILKMISPVTLIDTSSLTYKYYNINILGFPLNITSVALVIIFIYIFVFAGITMIAFSRNIEIEIVQAKFIRKKRKYNIKGMARIEFRKLLLVNKGWIILLALIILQSFMIRNVDTEMSDTQKYYESYMKDLQGTPTEFTDKYIKKEKGRFKKIQEKYDRNTQMYLEGKIREEAMLLIDDEYSWDMMPYEAFKMITKQNKYLTKLKNKQQVKGWFVNDIGINYIIHPNQIYSETVAWIFMMLAMLLLVILCFAYEEETGMKHLTNTMLYGTNKLNCTKWSVSLVMVTMVFLISNIPYLILTLSSYNFSGIWAPLKSLQEFEKFPINIPILPFLILLYVIKYFITLFAMLIVVMIAKKCRGQIKKIAISFIIIVMPLIIFVLS